jgi:GNAT superfamily N-acetyltransferase
MSNNTIVHPVNRIEIVHIDKTLEKSHVLSTASPLRFLRVYSCQHMFIPYQDVPQGMQRDVVQHLQKQWGPTYTHEFIVTHWDVKRAYVLYVLYDASTQDLKATIGVDVRKDTPFITTLYVPKAQRKKGFATFVLTLAEYHFAIHGFTVIKLWCSYHMISFYARNGWKTDNIMQSSMFLMSKQIQQMHLISIENI